MKTVSMIAGVLAIGLLMTGLESCNKERMTRQPGPQPAEANPAPSSARMGQITKQLYAVGNDGPNAYLYALSAPPGVLSAAVVSGFFVGPVQVTNATGLAYTTDTLIISTGPTSNFPNRLLTYPYPTIGSPLNAPTIVSCPNITDIEYNEYDGKLYGILGFSRIVSIAPSGAVTVDLAPAVPAGTRLTGLCNYNALLSYCFSDGTPAPDSFYSYGPGGSGPPPFFLFSTDWDGPSTEQRSTGGGTQYVDAVGWEIVTASRLNKVVTPAFIPGPFNPMPVSSPTILFADVTSE